MSLSLSVVVVVTGGDGGLYFTCKLQLLISKKERKKNPTISVLKMHLHLEPAFILILVSGCGGDVHIINKKVVS